MWRASHFFIYKSVVSVDFQVPVIFTPSGLVFGGLILLFYLYYSVPILLYSIYNK